MTRTGGRLVRNLIEALNTHDLDVVASFYASDYSGSDVARAKTQQGRASLRQDLADCLSAFPDLCLREVETVGRDGRVAVHWIARGTHQGTLMRIPPTGRTVSFCGSSFLTVKNGEIQRAITVWDVAGMLRAIGLLPELETESKDGAQ